MGLMKELSQNINECEDCGLPAEFYELSRHWCTECLNTFNSEYGTYLNDKAQKED